MVTVFVGHGDNAEVLTFHSVGWDTHQQNKLFQSLKLSIEKKKYNNSSKYQSFIYLFGRKGHEG